MRKKIYFIHHFMQPGGVERQLYYLANGLAASNDVTVILCEKKGAFLEFLDKDVKVVSLETPYRHRLQLGLLVRIMMLLKKDRPDVLISFHGTFHWLAVIAGHLMGIKIVCVFHGYLTRGLLSRAHKFFLEKADGLIAVSQSVKNSLKESLRIAEGKITVIENAIDAADVARMSEYPLIPSEQGYFEKGTVFVSIGRLDKGKGFDDILEALSGIRKDCTLLIIGGGPEKDHLENRIEKLGLSNRAFMLGKQLNPYKFLARADFFVLASESEGLPTVILEAMCLGVPCICTRYRGGTEGVMDHGKNGYLVNPNDPAELRRAIELFLSKESRPMQQAMVNEGRNHVEKRFCIERYTSDYQAYLESLT